MTWDVKIVSLKTKTDILNSQIATPNTEIVILNSFQDLFNGNFRLFAPKKSKKQVSNEKRMAENAAENKNLPYFIAGRIYL